MIETTEIEVMPPVTEAEEKKELIHPDDGQSAVVVDPRLPGGSDPVADLRLPVLTIDFETYYDDSYSLKKSGSIPQYVIDPRFHVLGLAVCYPDGSSEFRTDFRGLLEEFRALYGQDLEKVRVVMHNAFFDYFILGSRCGQWLRHPFCTRFAAHLIRGPEESAGLRELAEAYELDSKGDLDFMKGVRDPSFGQLKELAEYARRDVELTRALYERFRPSLETVPSESAIIEHTVKMFVERPFVIDDQAVRTGLEELNEYVAAALQAAGYTNAQISGDKSFVSLLSEALAETGEEIPMKSGKNGPIPALARNDEGMGRLLNHPVEKVRILAGLRLMIGSAPQLSRKMEHLAEESRICGGRCHFEIVYHRAQHGRFAGGGGFNIQNIAQPDKCREPFQRTGASCIRRAIQAPADCRLVAADACQIEARILAWLAGESDLHDAFASGRDVYSEFASRIFGREVRKPAEGDENADLMRKFRNVGKTAILGLGYNMGVERFVETIKSTPDGLDLFKDGLLDEKLCAELVYAYREAYPAIKGLWENTETCIRRAVEGGRAFPGRGTAMRVVDRRGIIQLPSGREIIYPDLRVKEPTHKLKHYRDRDYQLRTFFPEHGEIYFGVRGTLYGGKITEHIVSGIARDVMVAAVLELEKAGWPVITHCHDEIVCIVTAGQAEECLQAIIDAWQTVPAWADGLILKAEGATGVSLADI